MKKAKILILEDESLVALELQHLMCSHGYECPLTFNNGSKAMSWALENSPDIILSDVMLKGELEGVETVKKIKEYMDIPVIFMSGHAHETVIREVISVKPQCYLLKPIDNHELMINIQITLSNQSKSDFL